MKKYLLFATLLLCYFVTTVRADQISDKQKQIDELESKVSALHSQVKTLADQIVYYDSQIALATLKISQSEDLITSISAKIGLLEITLQSRSQVLERQISETYKQGHVDIFSLFFSTGNFSSALNRFKYLQIVQDYNRKFLHDTQTVQSNFAGQKVLLEQSRARLEAQKKTLAQVRADRDNLLKQTKNHQTGKQKQHKGWTVEKIEG